MSQGHMLADVVAIIGETSMQLQRSGRSLLYCCAHPLIFFFFSCDRHPGHRVRRSRPLNDAANVEASFSLPLMFVSSFLCSLFTSVDRSATQCHSNPNKYFTTEQESVSSVFQPVSFSANISFF